MRGSTLSFCLLGILLLAAKSSHGLCNLENGTMARCHDIEDAKYIETYHLEILKSSVSGHRLHAGIFHDLRSLRHLDLSHGELEHIEPGTFRELLELRNLDLSHNKIANLAETSLDGLKKLRSLNIRRNAFVNIPNAVLKMKSLKVLDLTGNPLNCNCATLKVRDVLLSRGVHLSKRILCASPVNLKSKPLLEPDVQVICMFEEQDKEMQMDQPELEGSGEATVEVDPFDELAPDDFDEETHEQAVTSSIKDIEETPAPTKSPIEQESISSAVENTEGTSSSISLVTELPHEKSNSSEDELFFSEENVSRVSSSTLASTESIKENNENPVETEKNSLLRESEVKKDEPHLLEGSGEDEDLQEGSGIEGSGAGVPPISWDVPDDETGHESSTTEPAKTTDAGLLDMLWGVLWSTSVAPEEDTKKDLGLEEEEFINVSSERTPVSSEKPAVDEEVIVPSVLTGSEGSLDKAINNKDETGEGAVEVGRVFDDSKSGKVKAEDTTNAEVTDASATHQPKKGMGSYLVLAALLVVLGVLIGFAAYKGDFCRKKRKRNDPERGTELKDMRKSLLEPGNGAQPKISPNGNLENVPLVSTPNQEDTNIRENASDSLDADGTGTRYSGMIPDVIDPIKPPRKSFLTLDDPEKMLTNGKSQSDLTNSSIPVPEIVEPVSLRNKSPGQASVNGKNHHDSVSSLGTESHGSPSIRTSPHDLIPTNGSLGTLQPLSRPPLSPGAQRVKITLQENPDSVPKTPILITRTKAGENLVKTP